MKTKYTVPLEAEKFYHIYNRGNNGETLFYTNENYRYFLLKLNEYLSDFINIHAFCLLNNHFHLLIEVKNEVAIKNAIQTKTNHSKLRKFIEDSIEDLLSRQFRYFFISYAKSLNKAVERHGSLFEKPFKRKWIMNDEYYRNVMYYIHRNMNFHGYNVDFEDYPWSSYNRIIEEKKSILPKEQIIKMFEDKDNYVYFHKKDNDLSNFIEAFID